MIDKDMLSYSIYLYIFKYNLPYLNTSHVNVNLVLVGCQEVVWLHLNTSHVNVNLLLIVSIMILQKYLNTSHVNVNHLAPKIN